MTQQQLILEYLKGHDNINPAKMGGRVYMGQMFGSETTKRCRELYAQGKVKDYYGNEYTIDKFKEGRFTLYCLVEKRTSPNASGLLQKHHERIEREKKEELAKQFNSQPTLL